MIFDRFKKLSFLSYFSIVVSIFFTALLLGVLMVTIQTKLISKETQKRAEETAVGLSKIIVNPTLEKDYSRIIDIFNAIVENKRIKSIALLDNEGVSKVIVEQNGTISFDRHKYDINVTNEYNPDAYLVTTVTKISDVGILRLQMSIEDIKELSKSAMIGAVVISVLLAVAALLLNFIVLKRPLRELESLSAYAASLPTHYGMDAPKADSALELSILSKAMSEASHKLHDQTADLESTNVELVALNDELEKRLDAQMEQILSHERLLVQQSKMAAMGDMMGAVAHQWRQPLNALAIMIQDIKFAYEVGELDEKYIAQMIKESMNNIHFMSKTIDDFRNFFKPTKEKGEFTASSIIKNVESILGPQLKNNNIELTLDGDDFTTFGYAGELSQVVLNIIANSRDAILEKDAKNSGWINVRTEKNGYISICDNGGGIPQSAIDHIYEPYFTTKEQGKGTGIGLYMSKLIVEKHMGGALEAYNTPYGACFKIKLGVV